jgi:hypothetical protein
VGTVRKKSFARRLVNALIVSSITVLLATISWVAVELLLAAPTIWTVRVVTLLVGFFYALEGQAA